MNEINETINLFKVNFAGYYELSLLPRAGGVYDQYHDEWKRINLIKKILNEQINKKQNREKILKK